MAPPNNSSGFWSGASRVICTCPRASHLSPHRQCTVSSVLHFHRSYPFPFFPSRTLRMLCHVSSSWTFDSPLSHLHSLSLSTPFTNSLPFASSLSSPSSYHPLASTISFFHLSSSRFHPIPLISYSLSFLSPFPYPPRSPTPLLSPASFP